MMKGACHPGLDIFVDEEFRSGGAVQGGPDVGAKAVGSAWKHLGSFEQTRKENTQQPAVWAGASPKIIMAWCSAIFRRLM